MYGYIRINKPELKIKDYELYRGFYCSLCDTLSRRYGPAARLFLSYDLTFFAVFAMSAGGQPCVFKNGRCRLNPTKKCLKTKDTNGVLELAADLTVIVLYYKLLDNLQDGAFFEKLLCVLIFPGIYFRFRKAKRLRPQIAERTKEFTDRQFRVEHDPRAGIDESCEPTAQFLAELTTMFTGEANRNECRRFGYLLGRFIYLADAVDDLQKDIARNSFNPFISTYHLKQEPVADHLEEMIGVLELTASQVNEAYTACGTNLYRPVTDNVIAYGLYSQIDKIENKYKEAEV